MARVLLVDGDPTFGSEIDKAFRAAGLVVDVAYGLAAAHLLLGAQRFDVVLLDPFLPDGSGDALISTIEEQFPELAVVVVRDPRFNREEPSARTHRCVRAVFDKDVAVDELADATARLVCHRTG